MGVILPIGWYCGQMGRIDASEFAEAYFATVNADRFDRLEALFAPDAIVSAPGIEPRQGAEIVPYYHKVLAPYRRHRERAVRAFSAGTTLTVELRFEGELGSGGSLEFDAVDIFDVDDSRRIARLSTWYDSELVRRRLAVALAEGAGD